MYKKIRQKQRSKSMRDAEGRRRRMLPPPADLAVVTRLRIVPRNRLHPGTVVWVHIPFEDVEGDKSGPQSFSAAAAGTLSCSPARPP